MIMGMMGRWWCEADDACLKLLPFKLAVPAHIRRAYYAGVVLAELLLSLFVFEF
jgi:hypothetical protein